MILVKIFRFCDKHLLNFIFMILAIIQAILSLNSLSKHQTKFKVVVIKSRSQVYAAFEWKKE